VIPVVALLAVSFGQQVRSFHTTAQGLPSHDVQSVVESGGSVFAQTSNGPVRFDGTRWRAVSKFPPRLSARPSIPARDSMPVDSVTDVAAAGDGSVWVGTREGALRYANGAWEYRQGLRWLPDDHVRSVAVLGTKAFFATAKGIGVIDTVSMTFARKAEHFETEIDKRHRRTPYGYVHSVAVREPGVEADFTQTDSDNDGLWTAMYGAGECFACAAGLQPACERARRVFEALRFLGTVTQGGSHPAPPGFLARTILPASGPDPNLTYTPERDEQTRRTRDALWKVMRPRWPRSADGRWYWKADTSSDEFDGHYFFYGLYFDLVARSDAEKRAVREHVTALTDHLVSNGFRLIDHDGKPTRWGIFDPASLNAGLDYWEERGLNSISILSYLKTAAHITGNSRYDTAARELRDKHHYHMNTLIAKSNGGPGSGNQSDDEMAFMCLYHLVRYESDPALKMIYGRALRDRWNVESTERNPFFHFVAAAALQGVEWIEEPRRTPLAPAGTEWLEDSLDTLRRFPLDRFNWAHRNSHRADIARLPEWTGDRPGVRGHLRNGKVLPVDERFVEYWDHDPWQLNTGGDGRRLADGAAYLLPYYMGLYHGFIER
jgi:hypothetical protein